MASRGSVERLREGILPFVEAFGGDAGQGHDLSGKRSKDLPCRMPAGRPERHHPKDERGEPPYRTKIFPTFAVPNPTK